MTNHKKSENLTGIGLIVLAMAGFAVEDSIIKFLAQRLSPGQILVMIGIGGTSTFYILVKTKGIQVRSEIVANTWVIGRTLSELLGTAFFVLSLSLVPITTVSAIIQVSPLLVTLGAAVLLKEKVGIRRWSAITIGLLGVAIILKPWSADFQVAALLALLGVIGLSARDLATRRVPKKTPSLVLALLGFGATIPAGLILISFDNVLLIPTQQEILLIILGITIGVSSYYCIVTGMRLGEVSAVVPFRYSRLVFGVAIGVWFFDENLEFSTLLGSAIVVISGLYALWRETRLRS
jgi:drug/metabolite transporter (DMT)-like permease